MAVTTSLGIGFDSWSGSTEGSVEVGFLLVERDDQGNSQSFTAVWTGNDLSVGVGEEHVLQATELFSAGSPENTFIHEVDEYTISYTVAVTASGGNAELWVDDVRFILSDGPEPATIALLGLAGLLTLRRRGSAARPKV